MTAARSIAVVDDDDSVRKSVKNLLSSAGLRVETYGSAEAFLESSHFHDTSCVVLDLHLEGISGLALMAHPSVLEARLPIIMVTAHGDEEMRRRCIQLGAVAFLTKPFRADDLIAAVNFVIEPGG